MRKTIIYCDVCDKEENRVPNRFYAAVEREHNGSKRQVVLEAALVPTNQSVVKDVCSECITACVNVLAERAGKVAL